jgi:UDP-N-acetylglucosamine transferase subunit ALG13
MIFLTVGTQFPFDRLVKAVDKAWRDVLADEEIFAQIGESSYEPVNFRATQRMDSELFEEYIHNCSAIISHSGMGTIEAALVNEKPMLVMPRLKKFGEVVNDHQAAIAKRFESEGYLLAAYDENDIRKKLIELKTFVPKKRINSSDGVINRISQFLNSIERENDAFAAKR